MADEIPQFKDSQPVLTPVKVESTAQGYDDFAKILGSIAEGAGQKTEQVVSDQSQAMYINSVANIEQLKTGAQMRMLEHPDQADKISQQTTDMMDEVKQAAFVNSKDRSKLNSYIGESSDDVALKATETSVKQSQLSASFTNFANLPDEGKAIHQAALTDHAKAEQLKEAFISSQKSLVMSGAITPVQAGNSIKLISDIYDSAQEYHDQFANPDLTAKDYHALKSNPLYPGNEDTTAPINASTGWLMDHYNGDKSYQGVRADIINNIQPSAEAFTSLSKNNRAMADEDIKGKRVADGYINSGEPFPSIESKYNELSQKNSVLSYRDKATRDVLGNYVNNLKDGNFLKVMASTPSGNAIVNDFTTRNAAITNNAAIDPAQKSILLLQNKNKFVDEASAYAQAHHIPSQYVQPIPKSDVANVENSFQSGQNPSVVLQTLGQYSKQNQAYLANAMKNPDQRMVVTAVSLVPQNTQPQALLDFITANQTGRTSIFDRAEEKTKNSKDIALSARIATNLSSSIRMVAQNYDPEQSQQLQNAMIPTTLKYAKYLAQKDKSGIDQTGNINVSDSEWNNYVDQASKIYAGAFQKLSGTNWSINPQQMPAPLTNNQLNILADHVTNEGYKYLKGNSPDYEMDSARSRNPLKMIITPTNIVQAVDGNGKVYYSMPFTAHLQAFAEESKKRRLAESKQVFAEKNLEENINANPQ